MPGLSLRARQGVLERGQRLSENVFFIQSRRIEEEVSRFLHCPEATHLGIENGRRPVLSASRPERIQIDLQQDDEVRGGVLPERRDFAVLLSTNARRVAKLAKARDER